MEVGYEVHDRLEGFLADGAPLGWVLKQSEGLPDGRDHAAMPAITVGVVPRRPPRDVHKVPGAGVQGLGRMSSAQVEMSARVTPGSSSVATSA